ncbi:MAG: signal peptide peptidase SppA, partial [Mucinivorans sp.]
MGSFFKTFFACLLAIFVGSIASFLFTMALLAGLIASFGLETTTPPSVEQGSILTIDLELPIQEREPSSPLQQIDFMNLQTKSSTTLAAVLQGIKNAAEDTRIVGIYLKVPMEVPTSLSTLWELRRALEEFRGSGKFIIAFADSYSMEGYYLSSVGDCVAVNPRGTLEWLGMSATSVFYKGTLDKLGVKAEIIRHGKFKGAVEPLMLSALSDENRLQISDMVHSLWGTVVGGVAHNRTLDSTSLQQWASELSICSAQQAQQRGMVDQLYYRDQLMEKLKALSGGHKPQFVDMSHYSLLAVKGASSSDKIAVVYASGEIVDSGKDKSLIVGNEMAKLLEQVGQDDNIKAVVLRINSPGGSALASEVIHRQVSLLRQSKPVVVSMGEYAASGGYYIACGADYIVATPATLTGSIGVFGVMMDVSAGAKDKLGVTSDVVSTNPSADMGSMFRHLNPVERQYVQNQVDSVYTRFAGLVAQGRKMSYGEVDSLAQGRVWAGAQAVGLGLVDELGSLTTAVDKAAAMAGI